MSKSLSTSFLKIDAIKPGQVAVSVTYREAPGTCLH
jgi:hypothetical protein